MLNEYYERLETEYERAKAEIHSASKREAEARCALELAKKNVSDALYLAERIAKKQRRIEVSEYAQREIEIALYGVWIPW